MADLSFLPEDYVERKRQGRTNLISLVLFVIVIAAVVGAFFVTDQQRTQVRQRHKEVNEQFVEAARRLDQLDTLQARKQQMITKAKVTSMLLEPVPRTLILSELVNRMPRPVSLTEFNLETKVIKARRRGLTAIERAKQKKNKSTKGGPDPIEMPETEVSLFVLGVAATDVDIAKFMAALNRCPLFKEINLGFAEEVVINDRAMRKFRVDAKLDQDLDINEYNPLRVARDLKHNPMDGGAVPVTDPGGSGDGGNSTAHVPPR